LDSGKKQPLTQVKSEGMKKVLIIVFMLVGVSGYSQQDPLFTQYMFNKLFLNPAYAGSREILTIDILDRAQWIGIDDAPQTFTFSAHTSIRNKKVGIGAFGYRDAIGPSVNLGFMAAYSYTIQFNYNFFSFGLQGGIKYFGFDWDKIRMKHPEDYYFMPGDVQRLIHDFNLGFYYQTRRYFTGLSSKQLLENEFGVVKSSEGKISYSRLLRHYYFMAGALFPIDDGIVFRPSLLAKYVRNAPPQLDLNASFIFRDIFWVGASFRTQKAIAVMAEFRIRPKIRLGYSCDFYLNELQPFNYGSHELRLGFDLNLAYHRMKTPRYF